MLEDDGKYNKSHSEELNKQAPGNSYANRSEQPQRYQKQIANICHVIFNYSPAKFISKEERKKVYQSVAIYAQAVTNGFSHPIRHSEAISLIKKVLSEDSPDKSNYILNLKKQGEEKRRIIDKSISEPLVEEDLLNGRRHNSNIFDQTLKDMRGKDVDMALDQFEG